MTSGGKKIAPQPIEATLKRSPLVAGSGRPRRAPEVRAALIVPDFAALERRLQALGRPPGARRGARRARRRRVAVSGDRRRAEPRAVPVRAHQADRASCRAEFTIESGELTPTLKVKRKVVEERWRDEIEALYKEGSPGEAAAWCRSAEFWRTDQPWLAAPGRIAVHLQGRVVQRMPTRLVRAGLLTAITDGLFSSVLAVAFYQSSVQRLFQGVASTLLGAGRAERRRGLPLSSECSCTSVVAFGWSAVFLLLVMRIATCARDSRVAIRCRQGGGGLRTVRLDGDVFRGHPGAAAPAAIGRVPMVGAVRRALPVRRPADCGHGRIEIRGRRIERVSPGEHDCRSCTCRLRLRLRPRPADCDRRLPTADRRLDL